MKKLETVLLGLLMLIVVFPGIARAEIKIGVLAKRGATMAMAKWKATGNYLSSQLGDGNGRSIG